MARGYPDFFGFSVFPFYGSTLETGGLKTAPFGVETALVTVAGKGQIYNCEYLTQDADAVNLDAVRLYVDGIAISGDSFQQQYTRNKHMMIPGEMIATCYDPNTPRYAGFIQGSIPFGMSAQLRYNSTGVNDVDVYAWITYTLFL